MERTLVACSLMEIFAQYVVGCPRDKHYYAEYDGTTTFIGMSKLIIKNVTSSH